MSASARHRTSHALTPLEDVSSQPTNILTFQLVTDALTLVRATTLTVSSCTLRRRLRSSIEASRLAIELSATGIETSAETTLLIDFAFTTLYTL